MQSRGSGNIRQKIAEKIKQIALKTAWKSIGKSTPNMIYEVRIPKELLNEKERGKK